jgi:hypothetical protein
VSDCKNIDSLFALWKQAHVSEENPINTFPKPKGREYNQYDCFEKSFCCDGFITYTLSPERKTVLFILRESDVSVDGILQPELTNKFFVKEKWDNSNYSNKYVSFIIKQISEINCNIDDINIAYMNLNKRGGFGSTNPTQLIRYVKKYKPFIEKEIELINPDIIVCGGTYGTIIGLDININKDNIKDCYHPGRGVRTKKSKNVDC